MHQGTQNDLSSSFNDFQEDTINFFPPQAWKDARSAVHVFWSQILEGIKKKEMSDLL